ncbi:MAG TPA: ribonuclease P protein component [Candidatus Omnitrophota bacterium]|nr:ribonuclease P protein component [Candidatus Omnitrophota bacterium]HPS36584.1 ribonuclease P protein component [Candidatus Omnitrophota bacterium]
MAQTKRLKADQRIRRQTAFKNLVEKGIFARGAFCFLWVGPQELTGQASTRALPMIGIAVGRSTCTKATGRNILKRRIREIFREHQTSLKEGVACFVKTRSGKQKPSFEALEKELIGLFKKAGAWA